MIIRGVEVKVESRLPFWNIQGEIEGDVYNVERVDFKPGDVVIDIGAHIGLFSCYLAARYPFLTIHAYEPAPETFADLSRNAAHYPNIIPHRQAADVSPLIRLQYRPDMNYASSAHYRFYVPGAIPVEVPAIGLDEILGQHERVKFLKMDCEGSEWELLLNSQLLDRVEYLSLERHDMPQFDGLWPKLREKLRRHFDREHLRVHWVEKEKAESLAPVT